MVYEYATGFESTGISHHYGFNLFFSSNGNFYLYNAHGDVIQLIDEDGEILRFYEYDAFGNEKNPDGTDTNYFRYTGQYFDFESGTYYLRARYYNPANGRFTTEDPIQAGLNWYTYANSNPVLYIDPNGLDAYIFYLPEWKNEALDDQKRLMEYYGLSESEVILIELNSEADLTNGWNSMGTNTAGDTVSIDAVIINTHANPEALNGSFGYFDASDIAALDNKDVGTLILYGCNAGHLNYQGTNPASQFAEKVNGAPVLASDGTVYSNWNIWGLIPMKYSSKNDDTFRKWRNKADPSSTRDNKGWVVYQVDGTGKLNVYPSGIKKMNLQRMLRHTSYWQ
jgi:RHS repeat-associated protein